MLWNAGKLQCSHGHMLSRLFRETVSVLFFLFSTSVFWALWAEGWKMNYAYAHKYCTVKMYAWILDKNLLDEK